METLDDIIDEVQNQVTPSTDDKTQNDDISSFTPTEIKTIHDNYLRFRNPITTLKEIMAKVFQKHGIRSISEIDSTTLDGEKKQRAIIDEIQLVASLCVLKDVPRKKTVKHKKGDFKLDSNGNKIVKSDGSGYATYDANETETVDTIEFKPYWDYQHCCTEESRLGKLIEDYIAPFDKTRIVAKLSESINEDFAYERIRELTKYYKFEDEEFFIKSFAYFMSNLKSRTCGEEPPYPMMFSIYSKQGMGKTWLVDTLRVVVDELFETHCVTSSFDKAFGRFNSVLMTRGLITFSEAKGLTKADRDAFKRATTDNTIEIERKGHDTQTVKNMATFLCVANEPILQQLTGLEMNRRILEFNLIDRTRDEEGRLVKILDSDLRAIFRDILMSIPFRLDETPILEHLASESSGMLTYNMSEILGDIFRSDFELKNQMAVHNIGMWKPTMAQDTELISKNGCLRMVAFKKKCVERKVPVNQVLEWMSENGIAKKNQKCYNWFIDRAKLPKLIDGLESDKDGVEQK